MVLAFRPMVVGSDTGRGMKEWHGRTMGPCFYLVVQVCR